MHWQDAKDTLLAQFVQHERIGVIADMDGTLAPIVQNPADGEPTATNRDLLAQLDDVTALVAVVSGRAVSDVRARVNLPQLIYSGNHGLERWEDGQGVVAAPEVEPYLDAIQAAKAAVEALDVEGMWVEDKIATLSVHYRNAPDPDHVARTYRKTIQQIADTHDLSLFEGRMIFELRPPLNMHKGTVYRQLIEENGLTAALFIGDDVTDADAFKVGEILRDEGLCFTLSVGVKSDYTPDVVLESADVFVDGVAGVEEFLTWLLDAVKAS